MRQVSSGILLFLGNDESPMNYRGNDYLFRQDSTFLYFFGLDEPGLNALIDLDEGVALLFGDDATANDIVWTGPQSSLKEKAEWTGVTDFRPTADLAPYITSALSKQRTLHYLPPYRGEQEVHLHALLGIPVAEIRPKASAAFVKAVVLQRSQKAPEEIAEIEKALAISYATHVFAMQNTKPGMRESEIAGAIEGLALAAGGRLSFPPIFSIHGETLHNHHYGNTIAAGRLIVNDSGAESALHYAADITRTLPANGKFTDQQRAIYDIVLRTQLAAIDAIKPGVYYKEIHLLAATVIAEGLIAAGLMKGNTDDAVAAGAHALFFPHGLGHMMGLDVHDMENFGEKHVGYDETVSRSDQFGLTYLRLARKLRPGFVITVEPGIYFIPKLFELWKSENRHPEFINYDAVEKMLGFGGVRIEDDILVSETGCRVLGQPIPKTIEDVESTMNG